MCSYVFTLTFPVDDRYLLASVHSNTKECAPSSQSLWAWNLQWSLQDRQVHLRSTGSSQSKPPCILWIFFRSGRHGYSHSYICCPLRDLQLLSQGFVQSGTSFCLRSLSYNQKESARLLYQTLENISNRMFVTQQFKFYSCSRFEELPVAAQVEPLTITLLLLFLQAAFDLHISCTSFSVVAERTAQFAGIHTRFLEESVLDLAPKWPVDHLLIV